MHFKTYRVLETCPVFTQTNRLCHAERIVMLEPLDYIYGGGLLRCCIVPAICYVDIGGG